MFTEKFKRETRINARFPRIYAHRGSTLLAPENTLTAFDLALTLGADVLETDIRVSKDNQLVVTHDMTLERTTNGSGLVRNHTLKELKKLDAGCKTVNINGECFGERSISLLSLDELFEEFPTVPVNIDIKDQEPIAAELVAKAIRQHGRAALTTVGSFHSRNLLYLRLIAPEIPTAAIRREVAKLYFSGMYNSDKSESDAYAALQIPVSYKLIPLGTRKFIERVKRDGTEICFWTINKPERMKQLLKLGADGIVTDRPDLAAKVFLEMGLRKP